MGQPGKDPPDHTFRRARRKDRSVRKELKTMKTHQIILAVGLASCLPLSAIPEGRCARGGDVFPAASGALVIEIDGAEAGVSISELSLGDVLRAFPDTAFPSDAERSPRPRLKNLRPRQPNGHERMRKSPRPRPQNLKKA